MTDGTAAEQAGDDGRPPSSARWGQWARFSLLMVGGALLANLVLLVLLLSRRSLSGMLGAWLGAELRSSYRFLPVVRTGTFLTTPLAAVTFLTWVYRARVRQRWFVGHGQQVSLAAREISPSRAVAVWFIPFVNLVLPYLEVRELFRAEGTAPGDRAPHLPLWWATFIGNGAVAGAAELLSRWGGLEYRYDVLWLLALQYALLVIAAVLCARWIAEFERRTARRTVHVDAPQPSLAGS